MTSGSIDGETWQACGSGFWAASAAEQTPKVQAPGAAVNARRVIGAEPVLPGQAQTSQVTWRAGGLRKTRPRGAAGLRGSRRRPGS